MCDRNKKIDEYRLRIPHIGKFVCQVFFSFVTLIVVNFNNMKSPLIKENVLKWWKNSMFEKKNVPFCVRKNNENVKNWNKNKKNFYRFVHGYDEWIHMDPCR